MTWDAWVVFALSLLGLYHYIRWTIRVVKALWPWTHFAEWTRYGQKDQ